MLGNYSPPTIKHKEGDKMKRMLVITAAFIFIFTGAVFAGMGVSDEDLQLINPNLENRPTINTQIFAAEQYGLLEMIPSEFDTLVTPVKQGVPMKDSKTVDIGTGRMDKDEFKSLQCAVASESC